MVIGLRMGLTALWLLDSGGWFSIACTATLHWSPPDSCLLDGLLGSTGCTVGKQNIKVREGHGVSAEFQSGLKKLQITLRTDVYKMIILAMSSDLKNIMKDHSNDELINRLIEADDDELFIVQDNSPA